MRHTKNGDNKKTEMEVQKVFIENLSKQPPWWKEYSLIIASLALCVSIYSAHLTRKEYIAAHRPYIHVTSRVSNNGDMDLNSVMIDVLNAPARIINKEISYIIVSTKANGEEIIEVKYDKKFNDESTMYPSTAKSQITTFYDFNNEVLAKDQNVTLRRKVRIDYKEFSTSRGYFFEGYWDYNRTHNVWQDKNKLGN